MNRLALYILLNLVFQIAISQVVSDNEMFWRMDEGERLMEKGKYEEAQEHFIFILKTRNNTLLPDNLTYLFGRNSYHLGKYKQCIDWLNKYLELKGIKGMYYEITVKYLDMANKALAELNAKKNEGMIFNNDFNCSGHHRIICPACKGTGVFEKQNSFGKYYQTCNFCYGTKAMTCEDYNSYMRGEFSPVY